MSNITIREVKDAAGWQGLEPHWDALLSKSRASCIFLSWDWMDSWVSVYGGGGEWLILVAEDEQGQVLGIAPMMVDAYGKRMPARWIKRLTLMGQKADTASEYLDWIIHESHEESITRAFCHYLLTAAAHRWDVLEFGIMRADAPTLPVMRSMFAEAWHEVPEPPAVFINLPSTWEALLAMKSITFQQRLARLQRRHQTRILLAGRDISVDEGLKIIANLNRHRWAEKGSSFRSERYLNFHHQIAERLAKKGQLLLMLMESNGQIIAGRYDFMHEGKGYCFQGGWLPEWEKWSVGRMILFEMMRHCIQLGIKEYDFLAGPAGYKDEWASGKHEILRAQAWRPGGIKGRAWQALRKLKGALQSSDGGF